MTSPTWNTKDTPVTQRYIEIEGEIKSNPIPFWDRVNAVKEYLYKGMKEHGYSKQNAEILAAGVIPHYIVHKHYYKNQPSQEGLLDIELLEQEKEYIIRLPHILITKFYWKPTNAHGVREQYRIYIDRFIAGSNRIKEIEMRERKQ